MADGGAGDKPADETKPETSADLALVAWIWRNIYHDVRARPVIRSRWTGQTSASKIRELWLQDPLFELAMDRKVPPYRRWKDPGLLRDIEALFGDQQKLNHDFLRAILNVLIDSRPSAVVEVAGEILRRESRARQPDPAVYRMVAAALNELAERVESSTRSEPEAGADDDQQTTRGAA